MSRTRRRWSRASRTAPWTCGHAAQRVRILDLVRARVVRALESRVTQEVAELGGHLDLSGMRPGELVRRGERDLGAEQRLDAHRRGHRCGPRQPVRVREEQRPEGPHQLGPVEEGQTLFRLERQRLQTHLAERDERRDDLPVKLHVTPADEREREMRERREIAGRADAPLLRDHRMDAQPQELADPIDEQRSTTGVAQRQRVRAQQEHRPDDLARERAAHAGRMRDEQVLLQLPGIRRGDRRRREIPEPGRHAIDDLARGDQPLDDVARLLHARARMDVERRVCAVARDRLHVGDRQVGPRQDDAARPFVGIRPPLAWLEVGVTRRVSTRPVRTPHGLVGPAIWVTHGFEDSRLSCRPCLHPSPRVRSACSSSSTRSSSRSWRRCTVPSGTRACSWR